MRKAVARKVKRKYTRRTPPDTPKLATEAVKVQINGIIPIDDCPHCFEKYRVRTGGEDCEHLRKSIKIPSKVTEADIALLPPSLRLQLENLTKLRARHKIPDNLQERTELMVRWFRGY